MTKISPAQYRLLRNLPDLFIGDEEGATCARKIISIDSGSIVYQFTTGDEVAWKSLLRSGVITRFSDAVRNGRTVSVWAKASAL